MIKGKQTELRRYLARKVEDEKNVGIFQGCGSCPFSAGSGSSKSDFKQPDPDPTGTYQE